jgi:electron transfer flavoprotein alpha/beta subunit
VTETGSRTRTTAAELGAGDRVVYVSADVTDAGQAARALTAASLAFGGVDLVIHAGDAVAILREAALLLAQQGIGGDIVHIGLGPDPAVRSLFEELNGRGSHEIRVHAVAVEDGGAASPPRPDDVVAAVVALSTGLAVIPGVRISIGSRSAESSAG